MPQTRSLILFIVVAVLAALPAPALGAVIEVAAGADDVVADDGVCTPREAVNAANSDSRSGPSSGECIAGDGRDTIRFPEGPFNLARAGAREDANVTGDLDLASDIDLRGAGASQTRLDARGIDRLLEVRPGATVTIDGLSIVGGRAPDGGSGSDVTGAPGAPAGGSGAGGRGSPGESGGGILNAGTLTISNSDVRGNRSGDGGAGGQGRGGFGNASGAEGGLGSGGAAGAGGGGGGIFNTGTLSLSRTTIAANRAGDGGAGGNATGGNGNRAQAGNVGGGHGGAGFAGAGGAGGAGGGIGGPGDLKVTASTITQNHAGDGGPGGLGGGGVGGNAAGTGAGGDGGPGAGGTGGAGGAGGGVSAGAATTIARSTLAGNQAGDGGSGGVGGGTIGGLGGGSNGNGGRGGAGVGAIGGAGGGGGAVAGANSTTNSTVEANRSGSGGLGGNGFGGPGGSGFGEGDGGDGGIRFSGNGGSAGGGGGLTGGTLAHATIVGNAVGSPGSAGEVIGGFGGFGSPDGARGAAFPGAPGAAATSGGVASAALTNTILANNEPQNCAELGTNNDGNVDFPSSPCPGTTGDPRLGPLGDNGGPTLTRALMPGSSALGNGAARSCSPTDQRGVTRPQGGGCEAGAYEVAPPGVTTGHPSAVTDTSVSLTGSITPNARHTTYHFRFGKTDALGSTTPAQDAGNGIAPTGVTAVLGGLEPGTTYHYRLVATNADGSTLGAPRTLTTAPAGDRIAPALTSASLTATVWAVNRGAARGTAASAAVKRGTAFRYTLSEDARVRFTIERRTVGHRVGTHCRRQTRANRGRRPCTLFVRAGSFAQRSAAGRNTKRFSGRIGRRSLKPARYRATLVATDTAGNRSQPRRLTFRIVRPRR